jgi:hypothetical protein
MELGPEGLRHGARDRQLPMPGSPGVRLWPRARTVTSMNDYALSVIAAANARRARTEEFMSRASERERRNREAILRATLLLEMLRENGLEPRR